MLFPQTMRFGLVLFLLGHGAALWAQDRVQDRPRGANIPSGTASPAGQDDLVPVKRVLSARQEYQTSLEELRLHYQRQGDVERVRWVEEELLSYHRTSKRAYRLELDVPPPTLTPHQNIPEANELFRRALAFKSKGWGSESDDNYRRAELLLQQLLTMYPQSDKLSEAALHLGDIYESRAFKQFRRSATYYERSFQWNPHTTNDSRLRAARLYDRVLLDRTRAVQLYREEMNHTSDTKRLEEARKRLHELSASP